MSRGFGTTWGTANTNLITTDFGTHSAARTIAFAFRYSSAGGSSLGRVFDRGTGENVQIDSSNRLRWQRAYTGATAAWSIAVASGGSNFATFRQNGATTTAMSAWLNGAVASVTTLTPASGTIVTTTTAMVIGNVSGANRVWDGWLAELAIWDTLVPDAACLALSKGVAPPTAWPSNLIFYAPLVRPIYEARSGFTMTQSGTAVQPHPNFIY